MTCERDRGADGSEHGSVEVSNGDSRREHERPLDEKADRRSTCGGQGASVLDRQLHRTNPDALSECESHRPVIGRKRRGN